MDLQIPLETLGRGFQMQSKKLKKLGLETIEDLLFHIPARYEDLSIISSISSAQRGETVTIRGKVIDMKNIYTRNHKQFQKAYVQDDTGIMECLWFNQPFIMRVIHSGNTVSIAGRVERSGTHTTLVVNEYEILEENKESIHTGRLVPIYPLTGGLSSKWLRGKIKEQLQTRNIIDYLPQQIIKENSLLDLKSALQAIHFPKSLKDATTARERLGFDEFFLIQLGAITRKKEWEALTLTHKFFVKKYRGEIYEFMKSLPFELTNAQKRSLEEILSDLEKEKPMNRLLEGDVGSGKTVVGAAAMYLTHLNGFQSVLMAPTEILANQHYETVSNLLTPFKVKVALITGKGKIRTNHESGIKNQGKEKKGKNHNLLSMIHDSDIVIGTHALLNEKIEFKNLGFLIIDEQQRFGVEQRAILRKKGINPHFLTMTATPIPRTVFLTLYGDLDLSVLNEMPKGRQIVKTWLVPQVKRDASYEWIKKQIHEGGQVFIVCPFIEESESMTTVKAAAKEFEYLKNEVFTEFTSGLLHGKMKSKEKDSTLREFRNQQIDILVSTPVVEVGVDIPNATIMVIEGADRFGLAQLHQLRGRVGRGDKQSYCLLFTSTESGENSERLKSLEKLQSGAELAELDLRLRGPGDMFGTAQHGIPMLKAASFSNFELIEKTKKAAEKAVLTLSENTPLKLKLESTSTKKVTPD